MKQNIKPTLVLGAICLSVALLLSAINMVTAPIIEAQRNAAANEALLVVMPDGEGFEEIDTSALTLPDGVVNVYKETTGKGYVFRVSSTGYKSGMIVMVGVDAAGAVTGTKCLETQDTFGKEPELDNTYNGKNITDFAPNMISGATMTSNGYASAVKAALQANVIVGGGEVDLRTPEQILNDTCNEALGTEGKTFEKWFAVEVLDGVDAIYVSDAGVVVQVGEAYVGIDAEGKAINGGESTDKVEAAYATYKASVLNQLDKPEGASKNLLGVWQTESGNYVFELQAAGYGINGDYGASGEYIKLKVALTSDGKIISVMTTYENETDGIGDICANPEYYNQFVGTDKDSYKQVENKTGATVTTSGYKNAIKTAFATLELLKGGAN